MTAYSYQRWNSLSQEEQTNNPGVSIPRDHFLNNPNRGVYWSGQSSATALTTHIESVLTGENREDAERMFKILKLEYRNAVEGPKNVDRAIMKRRNDADRAMESSQFSLNDEEFDQLLSVTDDVYRIQDQAEARGLNSLAVANAMIDRATSAAVGYRAPRDSQARPQFREYFESHEGRVSQDNLNQSVRQMYSMIRNKEIDALDAVDSIADYGFDEKRTQEGERELIGRIVKSIPMERTPHEVQQNANFSVRMDTLEEAKAMEMVLRWAGETPELPANEQVHESFNSWRDSGLVSSPFAPRPINRIGLIVGTGNDSDAVARDIIAGFDQNDALPTQLIVLTSANNGLALEKEISGRPVVEGRATATREGVSIEGLDTAPTNAIVVLNLPKEMADDSTKRSIAANAFVGSAYNVAYIQGKNMTALEAQAIHLAGSMRKLTVGIDRNGKQIGQVEVGREIQYETDKEGNFVKTPVEYREAASGDKVKVGGGEKIAKKDSDGKIISTPVYQHGLSILRSRAQELDAQDNPNRYYAAGHARPRGGVTAVVFDGARNYDAAVKRYANGKDPMGDGYSRIPEHAAILTLDNNKMAAYRFLEQNAGNRAILYAEASRNLSFAEQVGDGLDTNKVIAREAETELKIYDRPRSERTGDPMEEVSWDSPKVRGAIILVRGNATNNVINGAAQETKIAQEALIDFAHTGMIFDDMQKDFHAATLSRLALEMGKRFTAVNKEGEIVPLTFAREETKKNSQSFTEIKDLNVAKRFRGETDGLATSPGDYGSDEHGRRNIAYSLADPVGQMTLSGLPGMTQERAAGLAKLELTLDEVYKAKDMDVKKALYENGMPSDLVKNLDNGKVWETAVEKALKNESAARALDARFIPAGPARGNDKDESRLIPEKNAGYVNGPDHKLPIMAFVGNAMRTFDGPGGKAIDPADLIDRKQLSDMIRKATENGYAIGTTFEQGVGIAVIEEVSKIPEAKLVVATSGNPMAADLEMRKILNSVILEDRAQILMPAAIAPHFYETTEMRDGIEENVTKARYADMRATMQDTIAHAADVGVVVQASASDQVMNIVDKMNAQNKPIAVMLPNDGMQASLDAYRGNLRLARGAGRTDVESISLATVPSAQGYAAIVDKDTDMKLVDGVLRGNAGTFESARFARSDMARGGHHYKTIGWGQAARAIHDENSLDRFAADHKAGAVEPLGPYVGPTARELEKRALARLEGNEQVDQMFKSMQKQYASQVDADMMSRY